MQKNIHKTFMGFYLQKLVHFSFLLVQVLYGIWRCVKNIWVAILCKPMHSSLIFVYVLPLIMTVNNVFTNDDNIITNIHNENDGWILCEKHFQGHERTHSCCVCFGLARTNVMVTLKVLLWIFLCNIIDVCFTSM